MDLQVLIAPVNRPVTKSPPQLRPVPASWNVNPAGESSRASTAAPAVITLAGSRTLVTVPSSAMIASAGSRHS